jgi:hypothetical protein
MIETFDPLVRYYWTFGAIFKPSFLWLRSFNIFLTHVKTWSSLIHLCIMSGLLLVDTHCTVIPSMSGLLNYIRLWDINRFLISSSTSIIRSRALTDNRYIMRLLATMSLCRSCHWFHFCLRGCSLSVVQQYHIIIKVLYRNIILMSTIVVVRGW